MKFNHNKKRNTAFIYEVLVAELSKATLYEQEDRKINTVSLLKEFFLKGKILRKELDLYRSFDDTAELTREVVEKVITESKRQFSILNKKDIFDQQTKLINKMNKALGSAVWSNFVPAYKRLATINQVISQDLTPKKQVVFEQNLINSLLKPEVQRAPLPKVNNLAMKNFVEKFNSEYSETLSESQKRFLNKYIVSYADNSLEFKTFLYEEIDRLKNTLSESLDTSDHDVRLKIQKVLDRISTYDRRKMDKSFIFEVLKVQSLASELEK